MKNLSFASSDSLGRRTGSFASTGSLKRSRGSSNSVLISLPSVSKRQRLIKPSEELVSRVAEGIKKAVSRSDRLSALGAACATFDHDIATTHDTEIRTYGADAALCKHLGFLFSKKNRLEELARRKRKSQENQQQQQQQQHQLPENDDEASYGIRARSDEEDIPGLEEEIAYTCMALEMVFRCSASTLSESFERFGHDLLDLLLLVINTKNDDMPPPKNEKKTPTERPTQNPQQQQQQQQQPQAQHHIHPSASALPQIHHVDYARADKERRARSEFIDLSRSKSTRIMCHLARVGSATEPIARHPGVLKILRSLITETDSGSGTGSGNMYKNEARINSLWVLANLACAPGNMTNIARYPGMLDALLTVVRSCQNSSGIVAGPKTHTRNIAARGQAVRVVLNLSWKDENKMQMSERMELIDALSQLVSLEDEELTIGRAARVVVRSTRRHASGALRNIAAVASNEHKRRLCCQSRNLLGVLVAAARDERNPAENNGLDGDDCCDVRERVLAAIHNLACDVTAVTLGHCAGLLDVLEVAADLNRNTDYHIQSLAEKTLKIIARFGDDRIKCHKAVRQVMDMMAKNEQHQQHINHQQDNRVAAAAANPPPPHQEVKREKILKHLPHLEI